ncbi:MAG: DUF2306 domain-containing protein [Proteobacteria bacterium]|nr:DUF2306 domain-containing protein [Pseudomonadota bacterium]
MSQTISAVSVAGPVRLKYVTFAVIAAMMIYVLYHNERFLIDSNHPVWLHYEPFKWWLLPHGLAGACVLLLAPMQFIDGLRQRYTKVHRALGTLYVTAVFVLAPIGVWIQHMDEAQGAARSFTIETMIQSGILMITTGLGCWFALRRRFAYHRQWMIRSYAVALSFLAARVILGLTGLDTPPDWHVIETVVWSCTAASLLVGDIANQLYERSTAVRRPVALPAGKRGIALIPG